MNEKAYEGGPDLDDEPQAPTPKPPPKTVAIIACGPTNSDWHAGHFTYEPQFPKTDEVWTLNKALRTTKADLVFIMDDLVGEARRSPAYAEDIRNLTCPVITSNVEVGKMQPRVASRLRDTATCQVLPMFAPDMRPMRNRYATLL
jgi:hypothetical protein